MLQVVTSSNAPAAIGPYSQAIMAGGFLFASGQIPLDPKTMQIVEGGVEAQIRQVLSNMEAVLKAAGLTKEAVVKTTMFLKSMEDFGKVNPIYAEFFSDHKPARSTIEVARLPKDALVEIEFVAKMTG